MKNDIFLKKRCSDCLKLDHPMRQLGEWCELSKAESREAYQNQLRYTQLCPKIQFSTQNTVNPNKNRKMFVWKSFELGTISCARGFKRVSDKGVIHIPHGQDYDHFWPPTYPTWTSMDISLTTYLCPRGHIWTHPPFVNMYMPQNLTFRDGLDIDHTNICS